MRAFFLVGAASRPAGLPRYALAPSTPGRLGYNRDRPLKGLGGNDTNFLGCRMKRQYDARHFSDESKKYRCITTVFILELTEGVGG